MVAAQTTRKARTRPIRLETFSEPQRAFWLDASRYRAFVGGVGSGKTYAGAAEIIRQPARSFGMVVAPTYPMLRDATLRSVTEMFGQLIAGFNRSEMRLDLTNGTRILFRSADEPDRLRGPNIGWFWLDEAALMSQETWLIMIGRLREQPGRAWVTSTPRGKNWLYETFAQGGDDYAMIRSSTRDNPFLPAEFVKSLEASYTSDWLRQEVEGEFVDPAGALFRREWFSIVDTAPPVERWTRYWDLAASTKSSADYTASASVALGDDGVLYVKDMIRGRWEWPDARRVIMQTMQSEPETIHAIEEALHGIAAMQELRREPSVAGVTLRGIKVDKDKLTRAMPWAARAQSGKVALVRGTWNAAFLDEVTQFDGRGLTHDDQVDSVSGGLALVARGANSAVGAFG